MQGYEQVERAYAELRASGDIVPISLQHPNVERIVEEQKAYLTRRAAWYLNQNVDAGFGLLEKTSGNNVNGLSVDVVLNKRLQIFNDIASSHDDETTSIAVPTNQGDEPAGDLLPRWVQPTAELAGLPDGGNGGGTEPPPDDIEEKLDLIIEQNKQIINTQATHTQMLQAILDKPSSGGPFPINYPNYIGRLLGIANVVLTPVPRSNQP